MLFQSITTWLLLLTSLVSAFPAPGASAHFNETEVANFEAAKKSTITLSYPNDTNVADGVDSDQYNSESELNAIILGLQEYNQNHGLKDENRLVARSNIPILDTILTALKDSRIANVVIDHVLLDPRLSDITIEATIFIIKQGLINGQDLLIALQKSGLILQLLDLSLDDPEILPGLLNIGKDLLKENGINIFDKQAEASEDKPTSNLATRGIYLNKRESDLLNELFTALKDSGLIASITQHLLTTPDLAQPAAHFLNSIIKSGAISLKDVLNAIKESGIILPLLSDILHDKDLLDKFGNKIKERIQKGLLSNDLVKSLQS